MNAAAKRSPIAVFGITFQNPILLAAGTAGFGREIADVIPLDRMGGIVTKAVSPEPRSGNSGPRVAEFESGMLNAVGLANPGLDRVATEFLRWLSTNLSHARVIVNVVGSTEADYVTVVGHLRDKDVVAAFEINVSCPNVEAGGQEFGADQAVLQSLVKQVRGATAKPIIVKLAPNLPDLSGTARAVEQAGADGFTLVNTLPSEEAGESAEKAGQRLGFGRGGVSGPALREAGLRATTLVRAVTDLPIIGAGGITTYADARRYLDAGAALVAVGTAALADPRVPERLVEAWEADG